MNRKLNKYLQYGIPNTIADSLIRRDLSVSEFRSLTKKKLINDYGIDKDDVDFVKQALRRKEIDPDVLHHLLSRSNFCCNLCKGEKGDGFIIHHIVEYEKSQDNEYDNLIVLCPSDHDLAHREGKALTKKIPPETLRKAKRDWEAYVRKVNFDKAHKSIQVSEEAVDYINISRLEELVVGCFKEIPETEYSGYLQRAKILDSNKHFDQRFVENEKSCGRYLFDYMSHNESYHYLELLKKIAEVKEFENIVDYFQISKLRKESIEGKYVFFSGGVYSKGLNFPVTKETAPIRIHYKKRQFKLEWILDPLFMMSSSAIMRLGSKNSYAIYGKVRNVVEDKDGFWNISIRPFLMAQPKVQMLEPVIWEDGDEPEYDFDDEIIELPF